MINQELEQNLNSAFKLAQEQKHEFVTVEHLLLALLDNSDAQDLLSSCLLYTSPSPRDRTRSRMPSSA